MEGRCSGSLNLGGIPGPQHVKSTVWWVAGAAFDRLDVAGQIEHPAYLTDAYSLNELGPKNSPVYVTMNIVPVFPKTYYAWRRSRPRAVQFQTAASASISLHLGHNIIASPFTELSMGRGTP